MTVAEAAKALGVSSARVRQMAQTGVLQARKTGGRWDIDEASVELRVREGAAPGRKPQVSDVERAERRVIEDAVRAKDLYHACERTIAGCYDAVFLDELDSEDERQFCLMVADFFLRKRQRSLIAEGVY